MVVIPLSRGAGGCSGECLFGDARFITCVSSAPLSLKYQLKTSHSIHQSSSTFKVLTNILPQLKLVSDIPFQGMFMIVVE